MMFDNISVSEKQEPLSHDVAQRPGSVTLLVLVTTIFLMSLGILMAGMANSVMATSRARAESVSEAYLCESVAQEFVARLTSEMSSDGAEPDDAVRKALESVTEDGNPISDGVEASVGEDGACHASFPCGEKRCLYVTVRFDTGSKGIEVTEWSLRAVPTEEATLGSLMEM